VASTIYTGRWRWGAFSWRYRPRYFFVGFAWEKGIYRTPTTSSVVIRVWLHLVPCFPMVVAFERPCLYVGLDAENHVPRQLRKLRRQLQRLGRR
jgi:hypothetical protein